MRLLGTCLALAAAAAATGMARAQDGGDRRDAPPPSGPAEGDEVRLELRGAPLSSVLKALAARQGRTVTLPEGMTDVVSGTLSGLSATATFDRLLVEHGYAADRGEGNKLVVRRVPAPSPSEPPRPDVRPVEAQTLAGGRVGRIFSLRGANPSRLAKELLAKFGKTLAAEALPTGREILVLAPQELVADVAQSVAAAERRQPEERLFVLEHASVSSVSLAVRPLLTPGAGTLMVDAKTHSVCVADEPEVLERVAARVQGLDHPPAKVRLEVALVILKGGKPLSSQPGFFARTNELPPGFSDDAGRTVWYERAASEDILENVTEVLARAGDVEVVARARATGDERTSVPVELAVVENLAAAQGVPHPPLRVVASVVGDLVRLSVQLAESAVPGPEGIVRVHSGHTVAIHGLVPWGPPPEDVNTVENELVLLVRPVATRGYEPWAQGPSAPLASGPVDPWDVPELARPEPVSLAR